MQQYSAKDKFQVWMGGLTFIGLIWACISFFSCVRTAFTPASKPSTVADQTEQPSEKTFDPSIADYSDQVEVLGSQVEWRPSPANPTGPNFMWVTATIRNNSKKFLGAVWASLDVYSKRGELLAHDETHVYFAEPGERGKLPPGSKYTDDPKSASNMYLPDPLATYTGEQPVTVKYKIIGAFEDINVGPGGQIIN